MILIEIDRPPVPWRAHAGYGKRAYNPRLAEREYYRWQIKAQHNQITPISGPVKVSYIYHFPIPKGTSKIRRLQMLNGMIHHIVRPDCDNLDKFLSDTMTGLIYDDDSQIVKKESEKIYGEKPKTVIRIEAICH